MLQVQQITDDPKQTMTLILPDGSFINMAIEFKPMQYGWFITSLVYTFTTGETFEIDGMRIVNSPNMLRQYKNQIPFGLACYTTGNREPTQQEDFNSLTSIMYVLPESDVTDYENYLIGVGSG